MKSNGLILCCPVVGGIWYRQHLGPRDFVYTFGDDNFGKLDRFRRSPRKRLARFLGVPLSLVRTVTLEHFEGEV